MVDSKSSVIGVGLSLMPQDAFWRATEPLFDAGEVDVLEWSFDIGWGAQLPNWADELIERYSLSDRLFGHGVTFSPLSGDGANRHEAWLARLAAECEHVRYRHISEHFGFMSGGNFHQGAPLPVPLTDVTLRIGRDHLQRLANVSKKPVGLENLAFAFGMQDVRDQGHFLEELLWPVDGFLLLDLHNIYCQACNFDRPAEELLEGYPLDRVRELHVSGGSWSESMAEPERGLVRRDTHDEAVPEEVFGLVAPALARCPQVEAVIFERLGGTIEPDDDETLRADFRRLRENRTECIVTFKDKAPSMDENETLSEFQAALLELLDEPLGAEEILVRLRTDDVFAPYREYIDTFEPRMVEVAAELVKKWGRRSAAESNDSDERQ